MRSRKRNPLKRYTDNQISALYLFVFALSVLFFLLAFISFFSSAVKGIIFCVPGTIFLLMSIRYWKDIKRRAAIDDFADDSETEESIPPSFDTDIFGEEFPETKPSRPTARHARPKRKKRGYGIAAAFMIVIALSAIGVQFFARFQLAQDTPASSSENVNTTDSMMEMNELDAFGEIEVDRNLFNVTITIPVDYAEGISQEDLDAAVLEGKVHSAKLNEDGSITYVMSKNQHAEMCTEFAASIQESIDSMIGSDNYPTITDIKANNNFTRFTVTTTSTELSISESISVLGFYMYGGMYAIISGNEVQNIHVDFVNADTGEIISSSDSKNLGN